MNKWVLIIVGLVIMVADVIVSVSIGDKNMVGAWSGWTVFVIGLACK